MTMWFMNLCHNPLVQQLITHLRRVTFNMWTDRMSNSRPSALEEDVARCLNCPLFLEIRKIVITYTLTCNTRSHADWIGFQLSVVKPKPQLLFWLITANVKSAMNQLKLKANTCNRCQVRKTRVTSFGSFACFFFLLLLLFVSFVLFFLACCECCANFANQS